MAFRDHNPNVLSPILSRDKTWSNDVASPAAKKGAILVKSTTSSQLPLSSSNEQQRESSKNDKAFLLDIFNDFEEYQDESNGLTVSDGSTKGDETQKVEKIEALPPGTQFPATTSPSIIADNTAAVVPAEIAAVWGNNNNSKLATGAQLQDNATSTTIGLLTTESWAAKLASSVLSPPPPPRDSAKRTNVRILSKAHKDLSPTATSSSSSNNDKSSLQDPPAMIRKANATTSDFSSLQKLSSKLPVRNVQRTSTSSQLHLNQQEQQQQQQQPPKMQWAQAASSSLPPGYHHPLPPAKKTVQPFSIYTDREFQQQMQQQQQKSNKEDAMTHAMYTKKLCQLAKRTDNNSAKQAEAILREMIAKFKSREQKFRPDGACYNNVVHAYANAGLPDKAESIIRLMVEDFENGNKGAEPNVRVLNNVLHAWRKSKDHDAPERCEAILFEMQALRVSGKFVNCQPDTFAITVLLHTWLESGRSDKTKRAELIFRQMQHCYEQGNEMMRPDCIAYSLILNAHAEEMNHEKAEELLWEMVTDFISGNESAEPRTRNFNTVMAMYSKSSLKDGPSRAENVLERFRKLSKSGALPTSVKPDEYTYSLLLKSWVNSKKKDGVDKAAAWLFWMRDEYNNNGDEAACPDVVKYTTIISAYARNNNPSKARLFLMSMLQDFVDGNERAKPDHKMFEQVITTHISRNDTKSADTLKRKMWSLSENDPRLKDLRPEARVYEKLIVGYKNERNPKKAEALLWEMDRQYKNGKLSEAPTLALFKTVINAWHESHLMEKQRSLEKLRREMDERFTNRRSDRGSRRRRRPKAW